MKYPTKCKCCNSGSLKFVGNLDANRACWDRYGVPIFTPSNIVVPYFVCQNCGFIFTPYMDEWSPDDFKSKIYNSDYLVKVNPPLPNEVGKPVTESNGYRLGKYLAFMLDGAQTSIRILDYGAGSEISNAGRALKDSGFDYYAYEPYLADHKKELPAGKFDFIFAIEVIEHCHDLNNFSQFMASTISNEGILYLQTELHQFPTPENILESWYIAPRDGHISIFTFQALTALLRQVNLNVVQTTYGLLAFKNLPKYSNKFFV